MKKWKVSVKRLCVLFFSLFFFNLAYSASIGAQADAKNAPSNSLTDAILNGNAYLKFRLRYENADQDNSLKDANALTLRSLLGYQTGVYKGFAAVIEFSNVSALIDNYNSGGVDSSPNDTSYTAIGDPKATVLNQAYVTYNGLSWASFKVGRQVIILDNARFVGNVGFRQTEQRYDAAAVTFHPLENLDLYYAYVWQVNRVFGPDAISPRDKFESNSHFINLSWRVSDHMTVTPYTYLIDNRNASSTSNDTFGLSVTGDYPLSSRLSGLYRAEYAHQIDAFNNETDYSANYYHLMAGLRGHVVEGKVGYEVLGDGALGFQTPYATLHKFNGWADVFLLTPTDGLRDVYGTLSATIDRWNIKPLITVHYFETETNTAHLGNEIDFGVSKKINQYFSLCLEYANFFDAQSIYVNTQKVWLTASANFA
ncbi:MAG: alginate export family protein [Gammaproteobacteria bacterium]